MALRLKKAVTYDKTNEYRRIFEKINSILKEKGKMPNILDYVHPTSNPISIRTYEFDLKKLS